MKLDLQKDAAKIRKYIEQRIKDYPDWENLGPGEDADPIALITFGFHLEQSGYFALVIDTRPDADSDGEWTLHIENETNVLPLPRWCTAFNHLCEGGRVEATLPDGASQRLDGSAENEAIAEMFGRVILDTVVAFRDAKGFDPLPLAPKAFFIIEEFDGLWGWPAYSKRKSLGRLKPAPPARGTR